MKLYKDYEKMLPDTEDLMKKVQKTVLTIVPGAEIILFGSSDRGDGNSTPGWKLLILIDQTLARDLIIKITDQLYKVGRETRTPLGSIIVTKKDWNSSQYPNRSFKSMIEQEGILLENKANNYDY